MTETQALLRALTREDGRSEVRRDTIAVPRQRLIDLAKQLAGAQAIVQTILNRQ